MDRSSTAQPFAGDNPSNRFFAAMGKPPEEARFFWSGGPIEVAPRTWFASFASGATAFETDEGIVLVDAGAVFTAPLIAGMLRQVTPAPVRTAIYTHGHLDHAYGLGAFLAPEQARPRVVAHRLVGPRLARYARSPRHNAAINARQFGGTVDDPRFRSAEGSFDWQPPPHLPDVAYDERLTLSVGGLTFELHHARGETDDATWVFCPERGVLCPGDLFVWAVPNAGNPQKVQRYPWDWAEALRAMAALHPRTLCPGHGGPVVDDPERVRHMLLSTADFLSVVVERTLAVMEDDSPPHADVVRRVAIPRSDLPWLQPLYDEGEFLVRSVIRWFGGWYSGRPSELKPAPRAAVAGAIAEAAGGARALVARAREVAASGDLAVACHLLDYALEAAPEDPVVREAVAGTYERRAAGEESLMAINLYRSAAAYARAGRAFV